MASQQSVNAAVDAAIVPLNNVLVADLASGEQRFDHWLREQTGDYVTLERVKEFSAALPILGNIIAAVDLCGDIVTLYESRHTHRPAIEQALDWASLGINLIGVLPIPPGTAAARMSLRPTLGIVRQTVKAGSKELGDAIVGVIAAHVTATLMGELQPFVEQAKARLAEILNACADKAEEMLRKLADGLDQIAVRIASGQLTHPGDNLRAARKHASQVSASALVHSPLKTIDNLFGAVQEVGKAALKSEANVMAGAVAGVLPQSATQQVHELAADLRRFIPAVREKLASLSRDDAGTIMYMINILIRALQVYEKKRRAIEATVKRNDPSQAKKQHDGNQVESRSDEAMAQKPPPGCKLCAQGQPAPGTPLSIGFALGEETFTHTDFVLPGVIPVEWARTYRSNFGAHDGQGPIGPRWTTPFHASLEVDGTKLVHHDASGRSVTHPLPAAGKSHYDPVEQITLTRVCADEITLRHGAVITETFRREGARYRLTQVADRSGNAIALGYAGGQLASLVTGAGERIAFTHDEAGRITRIVLLDDKGQPARTLASYRYDEAGDLAGASDENDASWSYGYAHHLVTRYTDRTGRGVNLQWDGTDLDAKAVREWADDGTFDTRLAWHDRLRLTFVTDALGNTTQQYYDINGYPYRVVHADSTEEWFFRDAAKNVTRHVHPDGTEESFTWDERSNLASHTTQDGRTTYYVHDRHDNLTGIQDAEGYRWERYYDSRGNVIETTDPLGHVTKYEYSREGLPTGIIDAKGGKKQIAWRADGQIASFTDCSGKTSTWKYDARGRLIEAKNAAGEATRYGYEAGQLAALIHPDGSQEAFARDAEGRLLTHTDALARQTQYHYTDAGLLAKRVNARGDALEYVWNRLGQITKLRNENRSEYVFGYDEYGRLNAQTDFDGRTTQYYRAPNGQVTHRLCGGVMQSFGYDAMGRLARRRGWQAQSTDRGRVFTEPQGDVHVDEETYAYDGFGRVLQALNGDARVRRTYDALGNLAREEVHMLGGSEARTFVWRHEYDELGVRRATVRPDGHRLDWLTYGSGHVHGLLLDGATVADFTRDDAHRETGRELANGLTQTTAYDEAGRLARQVLQGTGGKVAERRYGFDAAGQLTQIADMRRGETRYAYDPLGRLTRAQGAYGEEKFGFDPASNIRIPTALDEHGIGVLGGKLSAPLLDNLLKEFAGTHYAYDDRGNLSERSHNGERMTFDWDSFDRMVSASDRKMQASYRYDALGRRISKHTQPHVAVSSAAGSGYRDMLRARLKAEHGYGLTVYGWDGDTLACELDCEQRATTHYIYEPGSFTPMMLARGALVMDSADAAEVPDVPDVPDTPQPFTALAYYHCDQIGTPRELTDASGEVAWNAYYQAWGKAHEAISEAARKAGITNPLRFAGQYFDRETGLHYNRHRYYDPGTGRFVSKDPIGLAGGINVYAYAPNPTGWVDPFGLKCGIPFGFKSFGQFKQFGQALQAGLSKAGFPGATSYMQGSATSGVSFSTGQPFDVGRVSDFDVAISHPDLYERAEALGIGKGGRTRPIEMGSDLAKQLGIDDTLQKMSKMSGGRDVNAMIFASPDDVKAKNSNGIRIPGRCGE
ncbi:RHS repeat-associated core domain-containing protein [Paraburkholderia sp. J94]|uniref:RHS repeat-associated core domain-containing protein n=1 Tax=Paraburkholderia sp. J94 TaxID=2805441 RepID=UPI002AB139C2|nr:RHS repeat-associated core domain-containing protein [Paraburkholderia sp. J94]